MKKGVRQIAIFALVLFTFVFSSCTSNLEEPLDEIEEEASEGKPIQGGTLSFAIRSPKHLNPILENQEGSYQILQLIFQPMFAFEGNYKVKGVLAEGWELQNNGETYVIHLREDVFWHDDQPFTANDVKFTIDALKNEDVESPYKTYVNGIKSCNIVDEHSIEINFRPNSKGNIEALTFPILPEHRYDKHKDTMTANKWKPIGTGPYQLKKLQRNKELMLELNENYWGKIPYIENVQIKLKNKDLDIIKSFESKDVDLLIPVNNDWNRFGEDEHLSIYPYATQQYSFIGLNHNIEIFKDVKVRKAIQLAINREEMLREIYLSNGFITDIPLSTQSWLYDEQYKPVNYQPNEAKSLLKEAGWKEAKDGSLYKEVDDKKIELSFELIIDKNQKVREKEAKKIRDYLSSIGIDVKIVKHSDEELIEILEEKDFEAILTGWGLSYIPDLTFAMHSSQIKNGSNFVSFKNKSINELLVNISRSQSEDERKSLFSQLQKLVAQEAPYIHLYIESTAIIVNNRIMGPIVPLDYNIFNNIEEWYIEYE